MLYGRLRCVVSDRSALVTFSYVLFFTHFDVLGHQHSKATFLNKVFQELAELGTCCTRCGFSPSLWEVTLIFRILANKIFLVDL